MDFIKVICFYRQLCLRSLVKANRFSYDFLYNHMPHRQRAATIYGWDIICTTHIVQCMILIYFSYMNLKSASYIIFNTQCTFIIYVSVFFYIITKLLPTKCFRFFSFNFLTICQGFFHLSFSNCFLCNAFYLWLC